MYAKSRTSRARGRSQRKKALMSSTAPGDVIVLAPPAISAAIRGARPGSHWCASLSRSCTSVGTTAALHLRSSVLGAGSCSVVAPRVAGFSSADNAACSFCCSLRNLQHGVWMLHGPGEGGLGLVARSDGPSSSSESASSSSSDAVYGPPLEAGLFTILDMRAMHNSAQLAPTRRAGELAVSVSFDTRAHTLARPSTRGP